MENKKYLPLKIVHLIFMTLGLGYYLYSLYSLVVIKDVFSDTKDVIFIVIFTAATVCALISGFLYLSHGYKKNAAAYFKGYVWILLINEIFTVIWVSKTTDSYLLKLIWTISLVLLTILTVGKDLGKTKSFAITGLFLAGKVFVFIYFLSRMQVLGSGGIDIVLGYAGQIIMAITTGLMVCGKYLDKAARGTK